MDSCPLNLIITAVCVFVHVSINLVIRRPQTTVDHLLRERTDLHNNLCWLRASGLVQTELQWGVEMKMKVKEKPCDYFTSKSHQLVVFPGQTRCPVVFQLSKSARENSHLLCLTVCEAGRDALKLVKIWGKKDINIPGFRMKYCSVDLEQTVSVDGQSIFNQSFHRYAFHNQ